MSGGYSPLPSRPALEGSLPQDLPVVGIPRDQLPVRGQEERDVRPFIEQVEDPPGRRDHGLKAGDRFMMARPRRPTGPLQRLGRAGHTVLAHRPAARIVQRVRPLIGVLRAFLQEVLPCVALQETAFRSTAKSTPVFPQVSVKSLMVNPLTGSSSEKRRTFRPLAGEEPGPAVAAVHRASVVRHEVNPRSAGRGNENSPVNGRQQVGLHGPPSHARRHEVPQHTGRPEQHDPRDAAAEQESSPRDITHGV